uniref:Uncharacterized protein n=1 Tax=Strongyloides papillosus TaxID=174720 RepID=A0A0N5BVP6_STREA
MATEDTSRRILIQKLLVISLICNHFIFVRYMVSLLYIYLGNTIHTYEIIMIGKIFVTHPLYIYFLFCNMWKNNYIRPEGK